MKFAKLVTFRKCKIIVNDCAPYKYSAAQKSKLLSGMHTTLVMLLHYLVNKSINKTSNIYRWAESIMVIFKAFK